MSIRFVVMTKRGRRIEQAKREKAEGRIAAFIVRLNDKGDYEQSVRDIARQSGYSRRPHRGPNGAQSRPHRGQTPGAATPRPTPTWPASWRRVGGWANLPPDVRAGIVTALRTATPTR